MQKVDIVCIVPASLKKASLSYLSKCLVSLHNTTSFIVRVIVVSNSPVLKKKKYYSQYIHTLLYSSLNDGFSGLNNTAIDEAIRIFDPTHIILLNDDAWLEKSFYFKLKKILNTAKPDVVVPLIMDARSKKIDAFGVEYFRSGYAKNCTSKKIQTSLFTAACIVIRTDFLKKLKKTYGYYFNPLLYFYLEDVELSIRTKMLNAKIIKSTELTAFHLGSSTSGKRSYFTMYQTYRNILWVIFLTWPTYYIARHFLSIFLVQAWVILYSSFHFGPIMYLRIVLDTLRNFSKLKLHRQHILSKYSDSEQFEKIFSSLTFRTYHGLKIKVS